MAFNPKFKFLIICLFSLLIAVGSSHLYHHRHISLPFFADDSLADDTLTKETLLKLTDLELKRETSPVKERYLTRPSVPEEPLSQRLVGYKNPVAAVIENHPSSRPQAGLKQADIVYEFLVEGGITRFMALYYDSLPEEIGPIRSLRSYMVETASNYSASVLHAGASPGGYHDLAVSGIKSLDEISRGNYYQRKEERSRPHDLFTGRDILPSDIKEKTVFSSPTGINPGAEIAEADDLISEIKINYWGNYNVYYQYDAKAKNFQRYHTSSDRAHKDNEGRQLTAENILVKFVPTRIKDDVGRLSMDIAAEGKLLLFQRGAAKKGYWRSNNNQQTSYVNEKGKPLTLLPGTTWIQVVPEGSSIKY